MTIRVVLENAPVVVKLEFPDGVPAGQGLILVVEDRHHKRLDALNKYHSHSASVNGKLVPVLRTVTLQNDKRECEEFLKKVQIEFNGKEENFALVIKPVYRPALKDGWLAERGRYLVPSGRARTNFPFIHKLTTAPTDTPTEGGKVELSRTDKERKLEKVPDITLEHINNSIYETIQGVCESPFKDTICEPLGVTEGESSCFTRQADSTNIIEGINEVISSGSECDGNLPKWKMCQICDFASENNLKFQFHLRKHSLKGELSCKVCSKTYKTLSGFKLHWSKSHRQDNDDTLSCRVCSESFTYIEDHQDHIKTHERDSTYKCVICHGKFSCSASFVNHVCIGKTKEKDNCAGGVTTSNEFNELRIKNSPQKEFSCSVCGKLFTKIVNRDNHMIRKHTKDYPYCCSLCQKGFVLHRNLDRHFREIHQDHFTRILAAVSESSSSEKTENIEFKCNYCDFKTEDTRILQKHLASHPEIRFCNKCKRVFSDEHKYQKHMENECIQKFLCDICGKSLSNINCLKNHMLCHGKKKPYKCITCGKMFWTGTALGSHIKTCHSNMKLYKCDYCSKMFYYLSEKKKHTSRVHLREANSICHLCPMKFITKRELLLHLLNGHKAKLQRTCKGNFLMPDGTLAPVLKVFKCDSCDFESYSRKGFLHHMVEHTGVWPYACDLCNLGFVEKNMAEKHIRSKHTKEQFPCPWCPRIFTIPTGYNNHLHSHSENTGFSCLHCQKYFETQGLYDLHIQKHSSSSCFKCRICGRGFSGLTALNYHMISHKRQKHGLIALMYSCDLCKRKFKYASSLAAHKYRHTQKIMTCEICGLTLRTNGLFQVHMRKHTNEKPFKCPYCDRGFSLSVTRKHHITRFHTSDFNIFCPLCQKGMVSNRTLRKHLQNVHGTTVTQTPLKDLLCPVPDILESVETVETSETGLPIDVKVTSV